MTSTELRHTLEHPGFVTAQGATEHNIVMYLNAGDRQVEAHLFYGTLSLCIRQSFQLADSFVTVQSNKLCSMLDELDLLGMLDELRETAKLADRTAAQFNPEHTMLRVVEELYGKLLNMTYPRQDTSMCHTL